MNNDKVKIRNVKTGAIEEVKTILASDYVGTGDFEIYVEKKEKKEDKEQKEAIKKNSFKFNVKKEDK